MLIVCGFNVYPPEVEAYFIEHDAVLDISIVGIADKDLGEVPAAAVHVTPGETLTGQQLIDWAYGDIASAKIPRYVAIGHELPYSGRGKVQKFILRDQLTELIEGGKLEKLVPTEVKEKKKGGKGKSKKK
jgi:fatty-acyl-CoA synthase